MDKRILKQQRIENILLSLKRFDYLSRSQIQAIHNLKSDRNANRILNDMSEYLGKFRHGLEYVYHLNKNGRDRVKHDIVRKKTPNIEHYLIRNQLWIHLKRPQTWQNETKIKIGDISIIADAKFNHGSIPVFVEVDVTQQMVENARKIKKYKKIKEMTDQDFILLWITCLESRKPRIEEISKGIKTVVYTYGQIK